MPHKTVVAQPFLPKTMVRVRLDSSRMVTPKIRLMPFRFIQEATQGGLHISVTATIAVGTCSGWNIREMAATHWGPQLQVEPRGWAISAFRTLRMLEMRCWWKLTAWVTRSMPGQKKMEMR